MITTQHYFSLKSLRHQPRTAGGWSIVRELPRHGRIRHIRFNDRFNRFDFYLEFDETTETDLVDRELVIVEVGSKYRPDAGKRLNLLNVVPSRIDGTFVVFEQRTF